MSESDYGSEIIQIHTRRATIILEITNDQIICGPEAIQIPVRSFKNKPWLGNLPHFKNVPEV